MITRLVKLSIRPDEAAEFEAIFHRSQALIEAFDGCQKTNLFKVADAGSQYFTISYWNTTECLENYRSSTLFREVWSTVKPLFSARAEAWTLKGVIPQDISQLLS